MFPCFSPSISNESRRNAKHALFRVFALLVVVCGSTSLFLRFVCERVDPFLRRWFVGESAAMETERGVGSIPELRYFCG